MFMSAMPIVKLYMCVYKTYKYFFPYRKMKGLGRKIDLVALLLVSMRYI
jgi:hypothetical protein